MTRWSAVAWYLGAMVGAALCGCGAGEPPRSDSAGPQARLATVFVDSLILTGPGGLEVWFTDGRESLDSAGAPCRERVMEIRAGPDTMAVPLLYTGEVPILANDSTLRARVWLNCRPGALYHVDTRTGRPTLQDR